MPSLAELTQNVLDAVSSNNEELKKNSATLQDLKTQQNNSSAALVQATQAGAGTGVLNGHYETPEVVSARTAADLDAQSKVQEAVGLLGGDSSKVGSALNTLNTVLPTAVKQMVDQDKVVQDNVNTKFLDNPLAWTVNQFTIDGEVTRANAARQTVSDLKAAGETIKSLSDVNNYTSNLIKSQYTAAGAASEVKVALANLSARVASQEIDNVGKNVGILEQISRMGADTVRNNVQAFQSLLSGKEFGLRQEEFLQNKKLRDQEFTIRAQNFDWAKMDHEGETQIANAVKVGMQALNVKGIDQFPDSKITQMLRNKDPLFMSYLKAGIDFQSHGMPMLGETPAEVTATLQKTNAPMQPAQQDIKKLYSAADAKVEEFVKGMDLPMEMRGLRPQVPAERALLVGAIVSKEQAAQRALIDPNNKTNIFGYNGTLNTLAETTGKSSIATTPLYQKVFKSLDLKQLDPELMLSIGSKAVESKLITQDEFSTGMSTIFSGVVLHNNATKQFPGVGIAPQGSYPIQLKTGYFGGDQKYEATSVKDWTKALLRSNFESGVGVGDTNQWSKK